MAGTLVAWLQRQAEACAGAADPHLHEAAGLLGVAAQRIRTSDNGSINLTSALERCGADVLPALALYTKAVRSPGRHTKSVAAGARYGAAACHILLARQQQDAAADYSTACSLLLDALRLSPEAAHSLEAQHALLGLLAEALYCLHAGAGANPNRCHREARELLGRACGLADLSSSWSSWCQDLRAVSRTSSSPRRVTRQVSMSMASDAQLSC
jgi:hypothetical protein